MLHMQIPKLVGNEGQAAGSDLVIQRHPVGVGVDADDDAHLKHNKFVRKRPLCTQQSVHNKSGASTIGRIYSSNTDQRIRVQEIRWVAHET